MSADLQRIADLARECGWLRAAWQQEKAKVRMLCGAGKRNPYLDYTSVDSAHLGAVVVIGFDADQYVIDVWLGGAQISAHLVEDAVDALTIELAAQIKLDVDNARADLQITACECDRAEGQVR